MIKRRVQVDYCLLGYGYASLIAYQKILEKTDQQNILLLRNEKSKQIFTIEHEGLHFSPLPIFPVQESELYNSNLFVGLPKSDPISVSFSELLNFDHNEYTIKNGSLASFMLSHEGIDQRLCLGLKQWGKCMLSMPFSQVRSKIERHYLSKNGNTRVGYVDGKSLFKYAIDRLKPNVLNYSNLKKIDFRKREVHTTDHIICYDKLVSTIPLHYLLQQSGLAYGHSTAHASAYFFFFKYTKGFKENQVVYDCNYSSNVLRLFSITDNFMLVQLRSDGLGKLITSKIKARVQELVPDIEALEFARELFVPMCYPLELISESDTLESISKLKKNGVIPFGRFGNWEYSDLHELDWSGIF